MAVIWVVERALPGEGAADALMGDFAVRVFGSLDSFRILSGLTQAQAPHAIVCHPDSIGCTREKFISVAQAGFPDVPLMMIGAGLPKNWSDELVTWPFPCRSHELAWVTARILSGRQKRRLRRFRDLCLDCEAMEVVVLPEEQPLSLPFKEARILAMLLDQAGRCVSRASIQETVWGGTIVASRTIDSHISRLRKRLQGSEVEIESVYGGGYLIK